MESKKILIVDDETEIRSLLAEFFKKKGYRAVAVESAQLGLNLLSQENFDVLISDIKMPQMDGIEFAARAKKLNPDIALILLTGYGTLKTAQDAIKIGVDDYLTKPIGLEILGESVKIGLQKAADKKSGSQYANNLKIQLIKDREAMDLAKNDLMALISHEFRTPITVLALAFDQLKDSIDTPANKDDVFNTIEKSHRRLSRAIQDITYYMDISKESFKLNKSSFDICSLLRNNFDGLKQIISRKKAILTEEFAKDLCRVSADKEKLLDAITRIIDNAAVHNQPGCEIVLALSSMKDFIRIEIKDNGKGIGSKIMQNIFKPFNIEDMMHHSIGLGLGLAISKKVIDLHKGNITVENTRPHGTKVTIDIPAN